MAGRELPPASAFAADDGAADPALVAVLGRFAAGETGVADVVAALAGARVLVPVVAAADPDPADGYARGGAPEGDRHASAGVVAVAGPDGRTALPVFTGVDSLAAWHPDARPVPVEASRAAAAAVQEGWDLLVLDPAGPVTVVVPRPAVHALVTGGRWWPAVQDGEVRPEVRDAVVRVVRGVDAVVTADVIPGRQAEVAIVLALRPGLTRHGLDGVLADVGTRLAADPSVTAAIDSLELQLSAGRPLLSAEDAAAPGPARSGRWRPRPDRR